MNNRRERIRKAAILLASVDEDRRKTLLAQMPAQQARRVLQAIVDLGPIDFEEQSRVIEEFVRISPLVPRKESVGIELDRQPPSRFVNRERGEVSFEAASSLDGSRRLLFRSLHDASPEMLVARLQQEHPQTIAVVVSHLPPDQAARVMTSLPELLQVEVSRRLVDLEEADPGIIREIEQGLESWLQTEHQSRSRRRAGLAALEAIVASASGPARERLLANLRQHNQEIASRLASSAPIASSEFRFADLNSLDDNLLGQVASQAEAEVLVLALVDAPRELTDRVFAQLPPEGAKMLRYGLAHPGPIRLSDVEAAQKQLAALAGKVFLERSLDAEARHLSLAV